MSKARYRVGLLTGTFDPVHLGHVALARAAQRACELSEVWFLVNPAPGHKQGVTPLSNRTSMVQLALEGETGLRASEPETVDVPGGHTTADFEGLMSRYPECEFVFIVGADVLATLGSWENATAALRLNYAVARRIGVDAPELDLGLKVQWFDLEAHAEASSRRVQGELAAGKRPGELDARVFEYISERGLYSRRL